MDENLEALKRGIVANPEETFRWLVLADYLEERGFADQAELLRLHRQLLEYPLELGRPNEEHDRLQQEVQQRLLSGVTPFTITQKIMLPGEIPMTFSWCPPGSFEMGGTDEEIRYAEKPLHEVRLTKGFWMGVTPVTQAQWQAIMENNPSRCKQPQCPVDNVSWEEAIQFCQAVKQQCDIKVRLPTEAEWEYACRAGTTTEYWSGDGVEALKQVGWFHEKTSRSTQPVGQLTANSWGLLDMHGNVLEWCSDWYDDYSSDAVDDPRGPSLGTLRVKRGGGWYTFPRFCRSAIRSWGDPTNRSNDLGFRVVLVPESEQENQ
jgi:uncharacterized protein (TIGR02996 family)